MQDLDYAVIQRILAGEKKAYAELVDRHKDRAMTLALKMLRNRQDAEEALQDAFVRAFNALPRFEWKSSFSTWFYRIVYNVCATELGKRDQERHASIDDDEAGGAATEVLSEELPPDLALESSEFNAIVLDEIEKLPDAYGPTFTLFFVQDMSYDEIAEVMGLPLGTIKARLFRARTLLRDAIVRRVGSIQEGKKQEKVVPLPARNERRNGTRPY
jgi:RNA polymerase sigma-70 factor (ECF subfamily)